MLDGWQLSGNTAFVSGDWAGVTFTTTDNFDFYGGGAGGRIVLTGADPRGGDNRDPNPDGTGSYLNWAAFARPSGRLDLGNAPQRFFRLPWIRNTDLSMFKNFDISGADAAVPLGDLQPVQHRELVRHRHQRAVQPRRRAGRHPVRQGDERARPAHHAGRAPFYVLGWLARSARSVVAGRAGACSPPSRPWSPRCWRGLLCAAPPAVSGSRTVHVTVTSDKGAPVEGLSAADLVVKEDGKTCAVVEVAPSTEPLSVALLLDDRGSDINEIRHRRWRRSGARAGPRRGLPHQRRADDATVFDYTADAAAMIAGIRRLVWRPGPAGGLVLGAIADALTGSGGARRAAGDRRGHVRRGPNSRAIGRRPKCWPPRTKPCRAARRRGRQADPAPHEPGARSKAEAPRATSGRWTTTTATPCSGEGPRGRAGAATSWRWRPASAAPSNRSPMI